MASPVWNFHERKDRSVGVIGEWLKGLDTKARARFERALDQLRQLDKQHWHKPNPASNIGNHAYVIRFTDVSRTQLRVFGHFHDPHDTFVMTFSGHEKDNVYHPDNYEKVAQRHRSNCDKDLFGSTKPYRCALCAAKEKAGKLH